MLMGTEDMRIESFDYQLQACRPFLKNTTTYYFADETFGVDSLAIGSKINRFAALLDEMGQTCSANVVELICHTVFKECKEVAIDKPTIGKEAVNDPKGVKDTQQKGNH